MDRRFAAVAEDMSDIRQTMVTKKDLAAMPTKDDVRDIARDELKPIRSDLKSIRDESRRHHGKTRKRLRLSQGNSHALERIAAIEKHLGITKKIVDFLCGACSLSANRVHFAGTCASQRVAFVAGGIHVHSEELESTPDTCPASLSQPSARLSHAALSSGFFSRAAISVHSRAFRRYASATSPIALAPQRFDQSMEMFPKRFGMILVP